MPLYRIHRLRDAVRQQFRWAPHTIGVTRVKPRDYEVVHTIEAPNVYAAWLALKDNEKALQVGDILEVEGGELRIYKYVGFEEAEWFVAEPKPVPEGGLVSADPPSIAT